MPAPRRLLLLLALVAFAFGSRAQTPDLSVLNQALKASIPAYGHVPFHARLSISGPAPEYSATIELTWLAPQRYRRQIVSPSFKQVRIVDGEKVFEANDGDFLPRWLDDLAGALLDPVPQTQFREVPTQSSGSVMQSNGITVQACVSRDDRVNGITDQLTWGSVCFWPSPTPLLRSYLSFNHALDFANFQTFGSQQVPFTINTSVLDYKPVTATVVELTEQTPDDSVLAFPAGGATNGPIETAFVSTLKEESLFDHPPTIVWPTVREGRTDGYMIVYARTDRTGQVRETAKHNSDNPGLEQFGMEQALRYKFHPLLVGGVPVQMEMPLVLHFTTRVADPLPYLTDEQTRLQISGCSLPKPKPGALTTKVIVSVNEAGKLTGERVLHPDAPGDRPAPFFLMNHSCRFAPYIVNGKASYFHGEVLLAR